MEEQPATEILLLDASCLLNLYATGRLRDIALAVGWRLRVVRYVVDAEALYVRQANAVGEVQDVNPVDLTPLICEGLIETFDLAGPAEQAYFVLLASMIDDGEAITGSVAINRSLAIGIDDRKARRVLSEQSPEIVLVSTLDILQEWSTTVPETELRDALLTMSSAANYVPGRRDPLYDWWYNIVGRSAD